MSHRCAPGGTPLVDATVHGYVSEVESGQLRHPGGRTAEGISTRVG
ncbi:hypothetical protein ACFQL0_04940 [Haloplanus litoreus]